MAAQVLTRKLTTILHADVQGYSRLIEQDEVATLRVLTPYLQLMKELVHQYGGKSIGSRGDSLLAEFPSVRSAVQSAVEMQHELKGRNAALPAEQRVAFRMGIHVGEIVQDGEQLHGDGINIAVRIEGLAAAGGICISDTVYQQVKTKLPLQYEDLGHQRLKNIAEPVRVYRVVLEDTAAPAGRARWRRALTLARPRKTRLALLAVGVLIAGGIVALLSPSLPPFRLPHSTFHTQEALPLPDKPSIVVLPFINLSNDPEQEYFSDGLTETLTGDLSKISSLFVIARNSAFTYKGKAVKVQDVGREMGVRYVLEGSVLKADNQVRITAQLIEATTGYHLWSERYDRPLQDIFAVQDEITQQIVTMLRAEVWEAELARVKRLPTEDLNAYDYRLRGWEYFFHSTKEANAQARQMCERAIGLDPTYAEAYAGLGWTYLIDWNWQWTQDPQTLERAFELGQKAIALDNSSSLAYGLLSGIYLRKKQYDQAITAGERAIALDPNFADGYVLLAEVLNYAGRPAEAISLVEKAMRLNPRYPGWYPFNLGFAYHLTGRYEEAITILQEVVTRYPNLLGAHRILAEVYSAIGREEEARAEVTEVLRISPNSSLEVWRQRLPYKALRKAGLK
jgi:adenylate cyclase